MPVTDFTHSTLSSPPPYRRQRKRKISLASTKAHVLAAYLWARRNPWKVAGGAVGLGVLYFAVLWLTLPDVTKTLFAAQSTVITDRNGTELYRLFSEEDRTYVPAAEIPEQMKQAIIAIEDQRFATRGCLDIRALGRVVVTLGSRGGASTITRQLARNALDLQNENIVSRKLKELFLGCELEWKYGKDKVLELYLNWIPFGANAYGIEQASHRFFGQSASGLTLAQAATLASLPQRPSYFAPYGNHRYTTVSDAVVQKIAAGDITTADEIPDDEITIGLLGNKVGTGSHLIYLGGRADQVLQNMVDLGFIQESEMRAAQNEFATLVFQSTREDIRAPHFVLWVKQQVEDMLADSGEDRLIAEGGLTVETTLDWTLQQLAEEAVKDRVETNVKLYGAHNAALVSLDPRTREVLAYVGNADYNDEEHDGKVDMARADLQPGSSFKPIVYAAAFRNGAGPGTVLHDLPMTLGDYRPQNFDGQFWGVMTARQALGSSRNIPAIKAYYLAGEEDPVLALAASLGAPTPRDKKPAKGYGPALAIGAAEVPLTEMTQAFASIADGGVVKPVVTIRRITDRNGNILPCPICQTDIDDSEQVLDPRIAYQITSILSDEGARPTDFWKAALSVAGSPAAAKTGTSNQCLKASEDGNCLERRPGNVWTIGYTPKLVAGVWVGNADYTPLSPSADGLNVAAPIWQQFLSSANAKVEGPATFTQPEGLVTVLASGLSGELPSDCTPLDLRKPELFLAERAPTLPDPGCVSVLVDKVTGTLASSLCPPEAAESGSYLVPQSVLSGRFPQWVQAVADWATGSGAVLPLVPTETCDASKTPGRLEKPTVNILSPGGMQLATAPTFRMKLAIETGSSVREVHALIDDKPVMDEVEPPFTYTVRVPKSMDLTGVHTLKVRVLDRFYNEATDEVQIRFGEDSGAPMVRITSPEPEAVFTTADTLTVTAEASENEGALKSVKFYVDQQLITSRPKEPYEAIIPLSDYSGRRRIRVTAEDSAGNVSEDVITIMINQPSGTGATLPEGNDY